MDDQQLAASILERWAGALDLRPTSPTLAALLVDTERILDPALRAQVGGLVQANTDDETQRPSPDEVVGDDLVTACNLARRCLWLAVEAGPSAIDPRAAAIADRLEALTASSTQLSLLGISNLFLSMALAYRSRFGASGVSSERIELIERLFKLPAHGTWSRAHLIALGRFSDDVIDTGRADLWQQVIEDLRVNLAGQLPGAIPLTIASYTLGIISEDSRWYRAQRTWDQAEELLADALTGHDPIPPGYSDALSIDLALAFLRNRDLDERPYLDVISDTYDTVHGRIQPSGRGDLLAKFALLLSHLRTSPRRSAALVRGWVNRARDEGATDRDELPQEPDPVEQAVAVAEAMELVLNLRANDDERVLEQIVAEGSTDAVLQRLDLVVNEGSSPRLARDLDLEGSRLPDPHLGMAMRLAGAAVLSRYDLAAGQARFGALGGLGSDTDGEPEGVRRLRFGVSQVLMPEEVEEADESRVEGVPPELYSDDPSDRLWAMRSQFGAPAFMSAIGELEEFQERLPVLIELYTRGIADIDERVVEESVIFARRIIYGFQRHDLRADALVWARRVAEDLRYSTGPRTLRARVLALHDVVREAERPEAERAAATMSELLVDNDADYAIVERALLAHTTLDWEEDEGELIRKTEALIPALIGAIEHDEYEQQNYPRLIRGQALWLFHRYCTAQDWPNVARCARIYLDWERESDEYAIDGYGSIVLRTEHDLWQMDHQTAQRMRECIADAWVKLEDLGPSYAELVRARGALNLAMDTSKKDLPRAVDLYESALLAYRDAARIHLDAGLESAAKVYGPLIGHAATLFTTCWARDNAATEPPSTRWLLTARSMVAYLRSDVATLDPAAGDELKGMVRLAANEDTFAPLADRGLVVELYRRLAPFADQDRDAEWIERFRRQAAAMGAPLPAAPTSAQSPFAAARVEFSAAADAYEADPARGEERVAAAFDRLAAAAHADGTDEATQILVAWGRWWLREAMLLDAKTPRRPYDRSSRAAVAYLRAGIHQLDGEDGDAQVRELIEWAVHPNGFVRGSDAELRKALYGLLQPLVDPRRDDAAGFAKAQQKATKGKLFGLF